MASLPGPEADHSAPGGIDSLPDALLGHILALAGGMHEGPALTLVCKRWKHVFYAEPSIWRTVHLALPPATTAATDSTGRQLWLANKQSQLRHAAAQVHSVQVWHTTEEQRGARCHRFSGPSIHATWRLADLLCLLRPDRLTSAELRWQPFAADLALGSFTQLTRLVLHDRLAPAPEATAAALRQLSHLRSLSVAATQLPAALVASAAQLSGLTALQLESGGALPELAGLTVLARLRVLVVAEGTQAPGWLHGDWHGDDEPPGLVEDSGSDDDDEIDDGPPPLLWDDVEHVLGVAPLAQQAQQGAALPALPALAQQLAALRHLGPGPPPLVADAAEEDGGGGGGGGDGGGDNEGDKEAPPPLGEFEEEEDSDDEGLGAIPGLGAFVDDVGLGPVWPPPAFAPMGLGQLLAAHLPLAPPQAAPLQAALPLLQLPAPSQWPQLDAFCFRSRVDCRHIQVCGTFLAECELKHDKHGRRSLLLDGAHPVRDLRQLFKQLLPAGGCQLDRLVLHRCALLRGALQGCPALSSLSSLEINVSTGESLAPALAPLLAQAPLLQELHLEGRVGAELPGCLVQLRGLASLALWCPELETLPPGPYLSGLSFLRLRHTALSGLPPSLAAATSLRDLDLVNNRGLQFTCADVEAVVMQLPSLARLGLPDTRQCPWGPEMLKAVELLRAKRPELVLH